MIWNWFSGRLAVLALAIATGAPAWCGELPLDPVDDGRGEAAVGGEDVAEPYVVYVAHEAIYARCGPDGDFYRTDPLRLGQQLEVYLETDDGWLGIRPPDESFSWVPAEDVELSGDGHTGTVLGRKVVAWIGTHLGRARKYRWQVELPPGEEVTVIGTAERQDGEKTEMWYRIVPPSGEFRWIHRTQVVDSSEQLVQMHRQRTRAPAGKPTPVEELAGAGFGRRRETTAEDAGSTPASSEPSVLVDRDRRDQQAVSRSEDSYARTSDPVAELQAINRNPVGSGVARTSLQEQLQEQLQKLVDEAQPAAEPRARDVAMVVGNDVRVRDIADEDSRRGAEATIAEAASADEAWVAGSRPQPTEPVATVAHSQPDTAATADTPAGLRPTAPPILRVIHQETPEQLAAVERRAARAGVDELQLELSRQLAAGASAGMVEPIRERAQQLIDTLEDSTERGNARLLLERVEQYQGVARRRDGEPEPAEATQRPMADDESSAPMPTSAVEPGPEFVRTGYLVQVYSSRPQAPPYALNDASGRTLAYVSPALGIRLRNYLNQHVGLRGETTFHTGLNTPHIIAREAVPVRR